MTKHTTRKSSGGRDSGSATVRDLGQRLQADRIARRMTWPEYAAFLSVGGRAIAMSTVYKIATGATTRPQALTVAQIQDRLALPVEPSAEGAATREVVSSGQRHTERSEDQGSDS